VVAPEPKPPGLGAARANVGCGCDAGDEGAIDREVGGRRLTVTDPETGPRSIQPVRRTGSRRAACAAAERREPDQVDRSVAVAGEPPEPAQRCGLLHREGALGAIECGAAQGHLAVHRCGDPAEWDGELVETRLACHQVPWAAIVLAGCQDPHERTRVQGGRGQDHRFRRVVGATADIEPGNRDLHQVGGGRRHRRANRRGRRDRWRTTRCRRDRRRTTGREKKHQCREREDRPHTSHHRGQIGRSSTPDRSDVDNSWRECGKVPTVRMAPR
jgi:hypothetical protein